MTKILLNQEFDSFEQLAEISVSWNVDFRQLSSEQFHSSIFQAKTDTLLISNAHFGCHSEQYGEVPQGIRTFAIPNTGCTDFRWFNQTIKQNVLLVFPKNREINAFTRPGFSILTFSISEDLILEFFERNSASSNKKLLSSEETAKYTNSNNIMYLRNLLRLFESMGISNQSMLSGQCFNDELQYQILTSVLSILADNEPAPDVFRHNNTHVFRTLIEYINNKPDKPLSMSELCNIANVSERTIQNIFKRELGISPKAYLKAQKMYLIHRQLWNADSFDTQIAKIAAELGIWHFGQFAADYKKLFGELPSKTLKRSNYSR